MRWDEMERLTGGFCGAQTEAMNSSSIDSGRVPHAPSNNWVYRVCRERCGPMRKLARWDRPIGWQLLMWPCLWSRRNGVWNGGMLGSFSAGRFLFMSFCSLSERLPCAAPAVPQRHRRSRHRHEVARTRSRPLPSGRVTRFQAKAFMLLQALVGLVVLLQFNGFHDFSRLPFAGAGRDLSFRQRFTDWRSFFLGLAFSWGRSWAGPLSSAAFPGRDHLLRCRHRLDHRL